MNKEGRLLLIAAANQQKVHDCVSEISQISDRETTLLTTKSVRLAKIDNYIDLDVPMLSEANSIDLSAFNDVIVIQHARTLIPYMNVYKFLRENGVEKIGIKTVNKEIVYTEVTTLLGNVSAGDGEKSDNVYWISPDEIQLCAGIDTLHYGQVVDGNWDRQPEPFEERVSFFISLKQHFDNDIPWSSTSYYQDLLHSVNQGEVRFNCRSEADIEERCQKLEKLYLDIKKNGWRQDDGEDFITINIGRNGELLFADGRHRLSIAKHLNLPSIPVKISIRHKNWAEFKNEINAYARENGGQIYAPLKHPDLQEVKYNHDDERFEEIASLISKAGSTVLDIGSHWGRACAVLEEKGHVCTAVEGHIGNFYFLNRIRQVENRKFTAVNQSIFDFVDSPMNFDVVLALNIFHHFLKTESAYEQLKALLQHLEMNEMFLQTHHSDEPQMKGAYKNYIDEEFAEFVVKHSCLSRYSHVSNLGAGRKLFHLTK